MIKLNGAQFDLNVNLYESKIIDIYEENNNLVINSSRVGIRKNYKGLLDMDYSEFVTTKYFKSSSIDQGWNFYDVTFTFPEGTYESNNHDDWVTFGGSLNSVLDEFDIHFNGEIEIRINENKES